MATDTRTTTTTNMTPEALAALQQLIANMQGGANPALQRDATTRQQEIRSNQGIRQDYSKNAAFSDAQGAMSASMSAALQELIPTLTRAAEGAGTSQNSLRALLAQDAASKAAQGAATLGLQAATAYGGVANNTSAIIEQLLRQGDPVANYLLQALELARGAVTTKEEEVPITFGGVTGGSVGGSNGMTNTSGWTTPTFSMSTTGSGQTQTQTQLDSINRQLAILGGSDNAQSRGPSMSLVSNNTF